MEDSSVDHPAAYVDPATRLAEIRQENRGGDVSSRDIDWLCSVASAAAAVVAYGDHGPGYDERVGRHLQRSLRKAIYRA